jgi:acetoin utilization deacetylase AcuC-like enzyme
MASGSTDTDYLQALSSRLRPALDKFQPDFILISAGFDAHRLDSLSGMLVTTEGFAEITRHILAMAEEHCNSRVVSLLEGGYDLHALAESVVAHVQELATENR